MKSGRDKEMEEGGNEGRISGKAKDRNRLSIRPAELDDKADLERLWQECFGDSDAFTRYYFDHFFAENEVLAAFAGKELIGQLHINPYRLSAGGEEIGGSYIVGVATDERFRHKGVMRCLLERTFELLRERQMPFAYLMPASPDIYRPFGFTYIYQQEVLVMLQEKLCYEPSVFRAVPGQERETGSEPESRFENRLEGESKSRFGFGEEDAADTRDAMETASSVSSRICSQPFSVSPARTQEEYRELARLSGDLLKKTKNLFTCRDEKYFRILQLENQSDGGDLLLFRDQNGIIAYVSYACEGSVEVREIYTVPGWEETLYAWMTSVFYGRQTTVLPLPGCVPGELAASPALANTGGEEAFPEPIWHSGNGAGFTRKMRPIIMGRILHLPVFLELVSTEEKDPAKSLVLAVADSQIPSNDGLWEWYYASRVDRVRSLSPEEAEWDVCLDIAALLEWLTGFTKVQELAAHGRMQIREGALERVLQAPKLDRVFINEIV